MQEIKKINLSLIEHLDNYLELITYGFTNPMPDSNEGPWKITAKDVINGKINYDRYRWNFDTRWNNGYQSRVF